MGLLDNINNPDDIKKLSLEELTVLSAEIRNFLVDNISKTGGHLASNLGVVELTLAIHKVFDTSRDRLVFDVGHQSYVHKIITGRKDEFSSLRQFGGMSGFPSPCESIHDAAVAGHASNSVSVALGMARARTLCNDDYSVISLIGDGAFTGGMAYEGLSDAGQSKEPLIVILNDNEMSITKNVGAMTNHLAKLRLKPKYLHFKNVYRRFIKKTKAGIKFDNGIHAVKNAFKNTFLPSSFFEDLGFTYLGPADGHDIKYMIYLLELARDLKRPVVIHLTTKKGKGYLPSETKPQIFHGIGAFDKKTGIPNSSSAKTFSSVFGEELVNIASENDKICAITAAMSSGVGLTEFSERLPERFFDVAIAEEHAVAMSAGLASQGMIPVVAVYSTFLQRSYDMIIHDAAISKQHLVLAVDRAGLVGNDGATHHGVFDVSYLSDVPGIQIFAPSNFKELRSMLNDAVNSEGVCALRYPRGGELDFKSDTFFGRKKSALLREGTDITLVSYGILINNVIEAAKEAEKQGISCEVLKLNTIKPLDIDAISASAKRTGNMIVVEDVIRHGSAFESISALLSENGINCKVVGVNTGNSFTTHGNNSDLYRKLKLDKNGILNTVTEVLKH